MNNPSLTVSVRTHWNHQTAKRAIQSMPKWQHIMPAIIRAFVALKQK